MKDIIPITVCVGYQDLLAITLRHNRKFFETIVVVTTPEDTATQELCKQFNVDVITSDLLYHQRARFNKSGMIHQAQKKIHAEHPDKWVLILDADILLPEQFNKLVHTEQLDKECLYSFHRVDYPTYDDFLNQTNSKPYRYDFMGFFQLYWKKDKYYPAHSMACSRCDMQFAHEFPAYRKRIIDEHTILKHLGEDSKNWYGRVTPIWEVPRPSSPISDIGLAGSPPLELPMQDEPHEPKQQEPRRNSLEQGNLTLSQTMAAASAKKKVVRKAVTAALAASKLRK